MQDCGPATATISALDLTGFRSHAHTRLNCGAVPAVVLIGANGSGKTSVLEAISMFSPGRGLRGCPAREAIRQADGSVGWHVRAKLAGDIPMVLEARLAPTRERARAALIDGNPVSRARVGEALRMFWLTPASERVWVDAAAERRRLLDRIVTAFHPEHAPESARYERAMRERNALLRDGPPDGSWLGALEARMAGSGAAISGRRAAVLERLQAPTATSPVLPEADFAIIGARRRGMPEDASWADPGNNEIWTEEELLSALRAGRPHDIAAGRTLEGPHRIDLSARLRRTGTPLRAASSGEQKGVLLGLVLLAARILAEETATALLLDEVAAHLDTVQQQAVCEEILGCGAQVWLTGTHPEVFAGIGGAAMWFEIARDAEGISQAGPMRPLEARREQ